MLECQNQVKDRGLKATYHHFLNIKWSHNESIIDGLPVFVVVISRVDVVITLLSVLVALFIKIIFSVRSEFVSLLTQMQVS